MLKVKDQECVLNVGNIKMARLTVVSGTKPSKFIVCISDTDVIKGCLQFFFHNLFNKSQHKASHILRVEINAKLISL